MARTTRTKLAKTREVHRLLIAGAVLGFGLQSVAEPVAFTNEAAYLSALSSLGYVWVHESFEEEDVWGALRSSVAAGNRTAASLTNLGVRWAANNETSMITTSQGPALSGQWGFYALPHGNYASGTGCDVPGNCGDGITGASQQPMYGVATWAEGFYGSKLRLVLDGNSNHPVKFPEVCDSAGENCTDYGFLSTQHKFFGVIEPAGFAHFEFRELEGTAEDQKFVWFDDCTVAFMIPPIPWIEGATVTGDTVQISVKALAVNARYVLERSATLEAFDWTEVESFSATSGEALLSDSASLPGHHAFYRLQAH